MAEASIRDLRNHGGDVVDLVVTGERVTITRSGTPVAELRALRPPPLAAEVLLSRWRNVPVIDPDRLRADLDGVLDPLL
ncbi:hypothetical protein BH20ACT2_BH20ACT2_23180 [soil metagenome]